MKSFALWFPVAAALVFAVAAFTSAPAIAVEQPWCLRSAGFSNSGPRCDFATLEQCQAVFAYSNGWCERNARFVGQQQPVNQPRRRNTR